MQIAREQPPSKVRKSRENPALSDFHDFFVGLIFRKCYFETAPIFSLLSVYHLIKAEEFLDDYFRAKTFILHIVIFICVYKTINRAILNRISGFSILNDAITHIRYTY